METLILIVFIVGYIAIATEHFIKINKGASALITAAICWTLYVFSVHDHVEINHHLLEHLADASGILFFLLGAMTIVELIDGHDGFDVITSRITTNNKKKLLWIICILTFFLSAILDNLTTTIVIISLIRKLLDDKEDRLKFTGMIIIAANAGGAWSPIGDVTTTMLWIGGQITAVNIILKVILPSMVCLLVPLVIISRTVKGVAVRPDLNANIKSPREKRESNLIFIVGITALLFVPAFKTLTGLPPFMGMLLALGIIWTITEILHKDKADGDQVTVANALQKIDTPSILFFLGILLSIGVLQSSGQLTSVASFLSEKVPNIDLMTGIIGVLSAIVDNVPLVAASQGMFSLQQYPPDHHLWEMLAYTTGTGGSILIIGSAAGVVAMGMEKISFFWYVKKFSLPALAGYVCGALVYVAQEML